MCVVCEDCLVLFLYSQYLKNWLHVLSECIFKPSILLNETFRELMFMFYEWLPLLPVGV